MDTKVHPFIVALTFLVLFAGIGLWTWGSGRAAEIGGPAHLLRAPTGNIFVQVNNQLLEHDATGRFVERHDLSLLGVDQVIGALGFFSDGDLLLRRGPVPGLESDARLDRCDLRGLTCTPFGSFTIDAQETFGLHIDWLTDDVFLTDTARHLLHRFDDTGRAIGEPIDGFRFPNHVLLHDDRLYIADTNRQRVTVVSADSAEFGMQLDAIDVVGRDAERTGRRWPTALERMSNGSWWVSTLR